MTKKRLVTAEPGEQTIAFVREFDAPAALVFRAHTEAGLIGRWTGPRGTTLTIGAFDARTGGAWSYVISAGDGAWAFHGSFHEVTAPRRIVQTWEYEGDPEHPTLEVLTFTDLDDGRSRLDGLSVFLSVAERDAMLGDMDGGMEENFVRLDELFAAGAIA